ncbi:MAG: hypothetical protein AABZ08_03655 [Planctomycetota bacterium]
MRSARNTLVLGTIFVVACNSAPRTISSAHLGREVAVIGPLEVPLGKIVTIDASIVEGDETRLKAYTGITLLSVNTVDGRLLPTPILIRWRPSFQVHEPDNWQWSQSHVRAIGFQNGEFIGAPDGLFDYVGPYATQSWFFEVYFEVLKVLPLTKDSEAQSSGSHP